MYLSLVLHIYVAGIALWLLWTSYRIGILKNYKLIRDNLHKPLPQPERIARKWARNAAVASGLMLLLCIATPAFSLPFGGWTAGVMSVVCVYMAANMGLVASHTRFLEMQMKELASLPNSSLHIDPHAGK